MNNNNELQDKVIKAFSGKMEKKEVLIMQFAMSYMEKGEKPPPKDEIEQAISNLISEGVLEEKEGLLILLKKPVTGFIEEEPEEEPGMTTSNINLQDYSPLEKMIIEGFSGKYENEQALLMQIIMKIAQQGEKPPSKDEFNETVESLIGKEILSRSGSNLVKKI